MEILKFGDNPSPNRSNNNNPRKPAAMIVAGVLVAMMGMSTTLAGTISISGGRVEFGQGIVNTAACDDSIVVTPATSFTNTGVSGDTFTVTSLTLSDVNATGTDNCLGKYLTIKAYSGSSATALTFSSTADTTTAQVIKFLIPTSGTGWVSAANSVTTNFTADSGWTTSAGTITLGAFSLSNSVTRFTIESSGS